MKKKVEPAKNNTRVLGAIQVVVETPTATSGTTRFIYPTPTSVRCPEVNDTLYKAACGATFQVGCGVDHAGGDMPGGGFYTKDVNECAEACSRREGCIDVSWVRASPKGPCYLKNRPRPAKVNTEVYGALLLSGCTSNSSSSVSSSTNGSTLSSSSSVSITTGSVTQSFPTASSNGSSVNSSSPSVTSIRWSNSSSSITAAPFSPSSEYSSTITAISNVTSSAVTANVTSSSNTWGPSACSSRNALPTGYDDRCIPCEGQPGNDPNSWCGLTINDSIFQVYPKTCNTVRYRLEITNTTIAPDGSPRLALVVNGQMPGPPIVANWGDTVEVTVVNKMQNNGTSIHFHGIRQNYTNQYDGVPSITQCPIAPGEELTYRWVANSYGSSWYHSHMAIQAWEGVFGPMIIHGPTSAPYDEDKGVITLQDWSHVTVDSLYDISQDAVPGRGGGVRVLENGLINGMNTWGPDGSANQTGTRYEMTFTKGKRYLLRILNASIQSTFKFYIDSHTMTVISADFTAIKPYQTKILNINIGQRYNVIVEADQDVGDYWMRSDNQNSCAGLKQALDIKAIIRYTGSLGGTPTSKAYNYTTQCTDEPAASLIPVYAMDAGTADITHNGQITVAANSANLFKWYLSGTTFMSQWGDPTLLGVYQNGSAPTYSGNLLIEVPNEKEWVYIIIQSTIPLPHPIHLHGHDFFVLASGSGAYNSSVTLNLINPPRRDTALMPGGGYLVVAFETDNPGVWLMHCHVGWHTSMGFALQIVEMQDKIRDTIDDSCMLEDTCKAWNKYAKSNGVFTWDSGV
ncbi:hypothetical protein H2201_002585 [Coniosporium apollinis]|uniref:Multicopper oxidase n=1 Tax=Coniosporium apollinis TaxID=61459 RepID=A0ABQ9P1G5_9PEZI|nr:hypothetical protein H2201_002585 [Coniosporium apollinis]